MHGKWPRYFNAEGYSKIGWGIFRDWGEAGFYFEWISVKDICKESKRKLTETNLTNENIQWLFIGADGY